MTNIHRNGVNDAIKAIVTIRIMTVFFMVARVFTVENLRLRRAFDPLVDSLRSVLDCRLVNPKCVVSLGTDGGSQFTNESKVVRVSVSDGRRRNELCSTGLVNPVMADMMLLLSSFAVALPLSGVSSVQVAM